MAHETPTLKAETRDRLGSRYAERYRRLGKLPAVIYGHQQDPAHVVVPGGELLHHLHSGAHLVALELDGGQTENCLVKDVQYDHLGTNVIHVDFTRVDLNETVTVSVTLQLKGQDRCPGAKVPDAVLEQILVDLEVECLATNIPDAIIVDISKLGADESITVGDLKLPEGVTTSHNPEDKVVTVYIKKAEAEEAVAGEPTGAEPEVITERKAAEGEDKD